MWESRREQIEAPNRTELVLEGAMQNCGIVASMWAKETLTTGVRPLDPMVG